MKKVISYSLWGSLPIYIIGAEENIKLAKIHYPDWICRFYVDNSISKEYLNSLHSKYDNCEFYLVDNMNSIGSWGGLFTRFLVADDDTVDIFIVRDCDSRLSAREAAAVKEWEQSNKSFHSMKDHPWHTGVPILGGMWGAKKGFLKNNKIFDLINNWLQSSSVTQKGPDQFFLRDVIYKIVFQDMFIHDEIGMDRYSPISVVKSFPMNRIDYRFIGERFDENNIPCGDAAHPKHWMILKDFLEQKVS